MQALLPPTMARPAPDRRRSRYSRCRAGVCCRLIGVVEIRTARALQQIAAGRRHVAQLPEAPASNGARQYADSHAAPVVGGEVGVADQRADAQAAVGVGSILLSADAVDVDEVCGVSMPSFIRSSRLVPPPTNLALSWVFTAAAASAGEAALQGSGPGGPVRCRPSRV